jgi:amino acid adenylation domain-containing protein/non-ribosomal peptide synthase protein (TIGR01720 family)
VKRDLTGLSKRLAGLSPEKRQKLEELLRAERNAGSAMQRREDPFAPQPLSFAQQRLWFLTEIQSEEYAYNIPAGFYIDGALDVGALERAVNEIVRRHETLRTRFEVIDGRPMQIVRPFETRPIARIDLTDRAPDERQRALERVAVEEAKRPFDLLAGDLVRVTLAKLEPERYALLFVFHHIVYDVWSIGVLVRELVALYEAFTNGRPSPLPDLVVQYADYARWQREQLVDETLERHVAYWREQLRDAAELALATDRPRAAVQTSRGGRAERIVCRESADRLAALSRTEGVTPFMTLLAGFQALLHRQTRQDDIVVGTPTASRQPAEVEGLIGFFVNSLVLRTSLAGDPTFRELVGRVRTIALDAYAHQDAPFDKLVETLRPERTLSRNPFFQVMFTYQSAPPLAIEGLRVTPFGVETDTATVDMEVYAYDEPDGLRVVARYNADLFDEPTIAGLLRQFERLLDSAAAEPDRRVSRLELLGPQEREQLLVDWNRTPRTYPSDRCIHEIFEEQAAARPDAIAASYGGRSLTYAELNRQANRLASRLRRRGVGPDTLVGLMVERSLDMIVGMLAILKAGGAYVPLDTTYPTDRLAFMLADTNAPVLLTHTRLLDRVPADAVDVICFDRDLSSDDGKDGQPNPARLGTPDHRAYVIYTSGSTGRPKGVEVPHRAVLRLVLGTNYVSLGPDSRIAQASNAAFDAATFEVWGALLNGGQLIGIEKDVALSPADFAAELRQGRITTLFLTTALFNQMAREARGGFATLDHVLFGGEAVDPSCVRDVLANGRPRHLLHVYGPTENTTFSSWYEVEEVPERAATVPIGGPIAATALYVLDEHRQPVPIGTPGELYVAGDGLARGYLNRPELTADAFVLNPFGHSSGARMYRTGDLVRWQSNGAIEFLGRIDQQVKIRGFRIEPGEVEAAVREFPGVRDATVIVRDLPGIGRSLVAYVVPNGERPELLQEVRTYLKERLPDYMVPAAWMRLGSIPLTPNGKVDRKALPEPELERAIDVDYVLPRTPLEQKVAGIWRNVLGIAQVGIDDNFFDIGGHSLLLIQVHRQLRTLGHDVSMVTLFTCPTVRRLAAHLAGDTARARQDGAAAPAEAGAAPSAHGTDGFDNAIAIIGMAGRFPGATSIEAFWENLRCGRPAIRPCTDEEHDAAGLPEEIRRSPEYINANGTLDDVAGFDAGLFGYTPREAQLLDPQQRIFLECAWEALERAGYAGPTPLRIGVYAGVGASGYSDLVSRAPGLVETVGTLQAFISNEKDFLTTRVSYELNLTGPSVTVQTACSTSLVAVHLACRSLLDRECDVALAGGVKIAVPQTGYVYQTGSILSPDGHCRAFDAQAGGTVGGSGAGIVVLRRLRDALLARDPIAAIIRGSAVNNDGALKIGYTAPAVQGQTAVIAAAQAVANVDPDSIGYIEAHGTGTPLGDPIEVAALTEAFRRGTARTGFCPIGSVKTSVGHLDAAAGVAGLIKTVLALEHEEIPASLDFTAPNPAIDFAATPFFVAGARTPWPRGAAPRRAGVSAFGIGGTNAHVVVEEAPKAEPSGPSRSEQVLVLSAGTPTALDKITDDLADHLERHPDESPADVAYTLQVGRRRLEHRRMLVCSDRADAAKALRSREPARLVTVTSDAENAGTVFLFPGQGAQYAEMGRGLYEQERVFRDEIDRCADILRSHLELDLRTLLYPAGDRDASERHLAETAITQPALFAVEYALAQLWQSWGVRPAAMLGHSIGEYVAACLAGVFTLDDALTIVAGRGRLIQEQPRGAMLAIALPTDDVAPLLPRSVAIAAVNAPDATVVAGPEEDIAALKSRIDARDVSCRILPTSHAFHSPMMEGALGAFRTVVAGVRRRAPAIPFVSNVTGTWITDDQATDPDYWTSHVRSTVQFSRGIEAVTADPTRVLLEVGPGRTLLGLATRGRGAAAGRPAVASMRVRDDARSDSAAILEAVGRLWTQGVTIDAERFVAGEHRRRVLLPTYPFEHQRYWVDLPDKLTPTTSRALEDEKSPVDEWFLIPSWARSVVGAARRAMDDSGWWLVLIDGTGGLGSQFVDRLERRGARVVAARPGVSFGRVDERTYEIVAGNRDEYVRLLENLCSLDRVPRRIVTFLGSDGAVDAGQPSSVEIAHDLAFRSVIGLARAIGDFQSAPIDLVVVTSGAADVTGSEALRPWQAGVHGLCRVIPQEYRDVSCHVIDVDLDTDADRSTRADELLAEIDSGSTDAVVAYRNGRRWVQTFAPLRIDAAHDRPPLLREGGVYLITGGLGNVGLQIAGYLGRVAHANLVLTTRSAFPERAGWSDWVREHDPSDPIGQKIRRLQQIEDLGARVRTMTADVTDPRAMTNVVDAIVREYGALNGVVHAAGVEKVARPIQDCDPEHCSVQLRPRVRGVLTLKQVLDGRPIDFCLIHSSLSTVIGALGAGPYTAGHAFMDAMVAAQNRRGPTRWMTVDWDNWRALESVPSDRLSALAISESEAGAALQRVFSATTATHLVVSTCDLGARIARWARFAAVKTEGDGQVVSQPVQSRPALSAPVVAPRDEVERTLVEIWQQLLGISPLGIHDNFFELGGDSVVSIQLIAKSRAAGLRFTPNQVFEHQTIAALAAAATRTHAPSDEQTAVTGVVALTPIQHWFFEQNVSEPHHFNQPMAFELSRRTDPARLARAIRHLVEHHDALRLRYVRSDSGWRQINANADEPIAFEVVDLSSVVADGRDAAFCAAASRINASLNLSDGPIARFACVDFGPNRPQALLLVAHHLVVDIVSWRVLIEDLESLCRQLDEGRELHLPPKTSSFKRWSEVLGDYAGSEEIRREAAYWVSAAPSRVLSLPRDRFDADNTVSSERSVWMSLGRDETRALLRHMPEQHNTQVNDVLLTALARAFESWTATPRLLLDLEGHGREPIAEGLDVSRTVGWFTTMFPVYLEWPHAASNLNVLTAIKQQLRAIPHHGIGYGALRYLGADAAVRAALAQQPAPELSFLYLGRFDQGASADALLRPTDAPTGPARSQSGRRLHLIEVSALVSDGQLQVGWAYSEAVHDRDTIETVGRAFIDELRALVGAPPPAAKRPTPADFPAARLDQQELDRLLAQIGAARTETSR